MKRLSWMLVLSALCACHAGKVRTLEQAVSERDARLAAVEEAHRGCVVEADTLRAELKRLQRKNAELAAWYESLLDAFGSQMDDGEVELVLYPDRSVLALAQEIHFSTGSATLSPEGRDASLRLAELILRHPDRRFQVEGHTDPRPVRGVQGGNWDLGAARAVAVVKELIDLGVPERQLSAATYAATSPVVRNDGPLGMARNRRIAVAFQPTLDETAAHQALLARAERAGVARRVDTRDGRVASE